MFRFFLSVLLFFTFLFTSVYAGFDLKITEVSVEGTDEWMEITNIGDEEFSGYIVFDTYCTGNIVVPPKQTVVLLDVGKTYPYMHISSPYVCELGFSDGAPLYQILTGNTGAGDFLIDILNVPKGLMTGIDNTKRTIERLRNSSTNSFESWQGTRDMRIHNIDDSYWIVANPGVVYDTSNSIVFPFSPPPSPTCPIVSITEVHRNDGRVGDYIELFFGSSFSGTITVEGSLVSSFSPVLQVYTGNFFVFGTQSINEVGYQVFPGFVADQGTVAISVGGSTCTEVNVNLSSQQTGQAWYPGLPGFATGSPGVFLSYLPLFPTFSLPLTASGCQEAFPNDCFVGITPSGCQTTFPTNCFFPLTINVCQAAFPTLCFLTPPQPCQPCSPCSNGGGGGSCPVCEPITLQACQSLFSGYCLSNTGTVGIQTEGYVTQTGFFQTGLQAGVSTGLLVDQTGDTMLQNLKLWLTLVEYDPPGVDANNEKIGITMFTGPATYEMSGWSIFDQYAKKRWFLISTLLVRGQQYVTTGPWSFINSKPNCIDLLDRSGQVHDTLCYQATSAEKGQVTKTIDILTLTGESFTGLESSFLPSFSGDYQSGEDSTVNTGNVVYDDNIATGEVLDQRQVLIRIINIVYDPKTQGGATESITLRLVTGATKFPTKNLRLRINEGKTLKTIHSTGMLILGEDIVFTKNFGFPNDKDTRVYLILLSGGTETVYDTYFYAVPKEENNQEQDANEGQKETDITDRDIRIRQIVYDPPGKDEGNEQITLELVRGDPVPSHLLRLRINNAKSTKRLPSGFTLTAGVPTSFVGTFGFPNTKHSCVELMYNTHVFDTLCYTPPQDDEEKTQQDEEMYDAMSIKIRNIVYDPPGEDQNAESITLSFVTGQKGIDLSDGFFLLISGSKVQRKQTLRYFGRLEVGETKTYTGNFRFPNEGVVYVSLMRKQKVYDTYVYGEEKQLQHKKSKQQEDMFFALRMKIIDVVYDPEGADKGKESITVRLLSPKTTTGFTLPKNVFLRRSTESGKQVKRSLAGRTLLFGQDVQLVGNWSFPNSSTCIEAWYKDTLLDTYCYYEQDNKIAGTKTKKKRTPSDVERELRLARAYIAELEGFLRSEWNILWYNSPLWQLAGIYRQAKTLVKQGHDSVRLYGIKVSLYDLQTQHKIIYGRSWNEVIDDELYRFFIGRSGQQRWWIWREKQLGRDETDE